MKFIMLMEGSTQAENGILPDPQLFTNMAVYNNELEKTGVLITLDGLQPSSKGARVSFSPSG